LTLINEKVYNCVLAMSAGLDSLMGHADESQEMLHYLGRTYRSLNKHLREYDKPTDSAVATVMSMAIHEDLLGPPKGVKLHVDALYRIVDIRGGIGAFETNLMLLQKMAR
jgi:hypothetical protein